MSFYSQYPPISGGATSNVSVGTNGITAPTSSTEVGGINPTGNLQPLQTDAAGDLYVKNYLDTNSSASITIQDTTTTTSTGANSQVWVLGTPTAGSAATFALASVETGQIEVSGTWTGTVQFETSSDGGTTYVLQGLHQQGSALFVSSVTANVIGSLNLGGKTHMRVRAIAAMTGTAVVRLNQSFNAAEIYVANALKLVDTTTSTQANIKAASTAALSTDTSLVVALNPGTPLNLPTGASTSALQTTGNTSLSNMDTKTPALGQALAAASTPVVLPASQITTLTPLSSVTVTQATGTNLHTVVDSSALPTGASTSALQTTGNTSVASIDTKTPALGQALMAASVPVAFASNQSTLAVSNTSTANIDTKTPALGVAVSASASPVTIASDQALSTAAFRSATGNLTAVSQAVTINPSGCQTVVCQMSGTFVGTVTFETSEDSGTNWSTLFGWDQGNVAFSSTGNVSGRIYTLPAYGNSIRARCSAYTSGTIVVTFIGGTGPMPATYVSPVTFFPIQGSTAAGSTGTGAQPVIGGTVFQTAPTTLTNGQTGFLQADTAQNLLIKQAGTAVANAPVINLYTGTPVTTAAYVTLVASTTSALTFLDIFDSSGQAMILATGAAASEVAFAYLPPGGGQIRVSIAAATRISIKALSANATSGYILLNMWK